MSDYKLVPMEPTAEMAEAYQKASSWTAPLSSRGYKAMLRASPAVQWEPAIRQLGIMGAAFDPPSVRRAYTYSDQPNNTTAWNLGRAAYKERSGGDLIDYGLQMLQYLQDEGFGVFEIDDADPAPQPVEQQPAPDVDVPGEPVGLIWSPETEPNDDIRYNHVTAETPLGRFSIEWKGWKDHDLPDVYLDGKYIDTAYDLVGGKKIAADYIAHIAKALAKYIPDVQSTKEEGNGRM